MTRRGLLLLAAGALCAAALAMARRPQPGAEASRADAGMANRLSVHARPEAPVDPALIRDVFRFAERPAPAAPRRSAPSSPSAILESASPPRDLPRLVGLVRRQGRLLAAFAADGDVVLAGAGETAAGVIVLEVGDEGVTVRRRDGSVERLVLP